MSALLECRGLACSYDDKVVLRDIDLVVAEGESVVLLGPNGSGKSTLLKACCRSHAAQAGTVKLGGEDVGALSYPEIARRVSFVPQEESFAFPFRVRDIVTMGRLSRSTGLRDTPEDRRIAEEAMTFADCLHLAERPITEISGGERQRALLARAMAQEAPLMLLDEPTSHLDVKHQLSLARHARTLAGTGKAIVTAIHDLNLAQTVGERAVLLKEGRIVADAPVREILHDPLLDATYGVEFERVELSDGRVALFANERAV